MIFGLRHPIFQAPTGTVAGPELAAAVANAGGMGAMGFTGLEPRAAYEAIMQTKEETKGLFQVNFVLTFEPTALGAALDAGVPAITFSWGDPSLYMKRVRQTETLVGIQVGNLEGAKRALALEPDFLICQGMEAGGHVQSTLPLKQLLPRVTELAKNTPVVASGGIATGAHIAEVLALGASAAMLGSRFVATVESRAHPIYKQKLVEETDTSMTVCFDGGWPQALHRVLRNSTLEKWEAAGCPPTGHRPGEGDILGHAQDGSPIVRYLDLAPKRTAEGKIEEMCLYAGQSVGDIEDIPSAEDLVHRLWQETLAHQIGSGRHHP